MSKTGKEHVKTLHDTNTTLRIEEMVEEFDKRWPIIETEIGDDHPYLNLRDLRSYYVKSLTQAHQAGKREGRDDAVEIVDKKLVALSWSEENETSDAIRIISEIRNTIKALQDNK